MPAPKAARPVPNRNREAGSGTSGVRGGVGVGVGVGVGISMLSRGIGGESGGYSRVAVNGQIWL